MKHARRAAPAGAPIRGRVAEREILTAWASTSPLGTACRSTTTPAWTVGERPRSSRASSVSSFVDLTADGNTTDGVLADLARAPAAADVVTLTAGGNDLLGGDLPGAILRRLHQIAERIEPLGARVVVNTIYDPSDGDDELGRRELGLSRLEMIELRQRLNALNRGIAELAAEHDFLLADIERLFHGHGVASDDTWYVQVIEPNLAGATAIAEHWHELLTSSEQDPG